MNTASQSTLDIQATRRPRKRFTADAAQDIVLVVIVLLVGLMAGAASFNHVHDWTLDNSPAGTADWFGWANAVISELIPTASLIEVTRRRRRHPAAKVGYPMFLLVVAVGISLTAQLAVAHRSVFGWMVSALPALAFFALSKLVFSATAHRPTTDQVTASTPATSPATPSGTTREQVRPAAAPTTRATPKKTAPAKKTPAKRTPAKKAPAPVAAKPALAAPVIEAPAAPTAETSAFPDSLLTSARAIATSHAHDHGAPITSNQLAVRLRVPTTQAADILTQLADNPTIPATTRPHNGTTIGATA
jgi:hypothetical protein